MLGVLQKIFLSFASPVRQAALTPLVDQNL